MSNISIINADSLIQLKEYEDESFDLIIADPPYNLKKDYGANTDDFTYDKYLIFSINWLAEAKRILKKSGSIYVFMGVRYISYIYHIMEKELGLNFSGWITWHYTQGLGKTKGFSPRHDDILYFTKSEKFKFNLDSIRVPQKFYRSVNNMRGANPGDVWEFSHVHYCNENRQDHLTQKPEGIIERMVLASSDENDNVLDPFSGSGTTLRVCQQLNRNCIGIEINSDYVESTKQRLAKKFTNFDSIDPRMERVPFDLRDDKIREEYLQNHINWFLQHHNGSIEVFKKFVEELYGDKIKKQNKKEINRELF
ncbi:Modification methylase HpaI [Gammaproteobacteria bacterium]